MPENETVKVLPNPKSLECTYGRHMRCIKPECQCMCHLLEEFADWMPDVEVTQRAGNC